MRKTLRLRNGHLEECIVHFSLYENQRSKILIYSSNKQVRNYESYTDIRVSMFENVLLK